MIVRAKLKPIEALPGWAICCERQRASFPINAERILDVDVSETHVDDIRCAFCGAEVVGVKTMRLAHPTKTNDDPETPMASSIFVDCFDFDEGTG